MRGRFNRCSMRKMRLLMQVINIRIHGFKLLDVKFTRRFSLETADLKNLIGFMFSRNHSVCSSGAFLWVIFRNVYGAFYMKIGTSISLNNSVRRLLPYLSLCWIITYPFIWKVMSRLTHIAVQEADISSDQYIG